MNSEISITPPENPADQELAEAIRHWDVVHPAYLRGDATKADDDAAAARRAAAEDAVKREWNAKASEG